MDSKHIKVNQSQQIEKLIKFHPSFCLFVCLFAFLLTVALCRVPPAFATMPHITHN